MVLYFTNPSAVYNFEASPKFLVRLYTPELDHKYINE